MGTRGSFPWVKRPGREADHSFPSSAKVRDAWSYTCTPPICLHDVVLSCIKHRDKYTFLLYLLPFNHFLSAFRLLRMYKIYEGKIIICISKEEC